MQGGGCPLSLVRLVLVSVDNDGYFGNEDNNVSHHWATLLMPSRPPPLPLLPPPHPRPADLFMSLSTTQEVAMTNSDDVAGTLFSPTVAGRAASSSVHLKDDQGYVFTPSHATIGRVVRGGGCGGGQDCEGGRRTEGQVSSRGHG